MKILTLFLVLTGLAGCSDKLSYQQYDTFATQFAVIDWCYKHDHYSAEEAAQFKSATEYNLSTWDSVDYTKINTYYRMTYPTLTQQACNNWQMSMHKTVLDAGNHKNTSTQRESWSAFNKTLQEMNPALCNKVGDMVLCN